MRNSSRNVRNAVRLALAACATTAYAQTAPAPATAPVEEVVVTGSRLLQAPNDVSISPITTITASDIQATGLVRTEDLLNNLPQVSAEQSSGVSISSVGVATVSLRALGSQRTLVLLNGLRMNPGGAGGVPGGNANAADIDQIPADLIERADVLTGGASAVYGADAVAGVVNFVLNTHYQGIKVDTNYSFNNHRNNNGTYLGYLSAFGAQTPQSTANLGANRDLSIIAGANFADGKGNATVYASYLNSSPAVGYQIDHSGCTLIGGRSPASAVKCGGSGTSAHGQFSLLGMTGVGATAHPTTIVDNAVDPNTGAFRPFNGTDLYNYGALSYFQRQAERYSAGAFMHYDVSDHASLYTQTMFTRKTTQAQYGPSGSFFQTIDMHCSNPLLTAAEHAALCSPAVIASNQQATGGATTGDVIQMYIARRSVESGGRQDNFASNSIRQVVGVKGAIAEAWSYDVAGQLGITRFQDVEGNFLGMPQITKSLDVVPNPSSNGVAGVPVGAPVCSSALPGGSDTACVPWNVWVPHGVSQAALNYLGTPATYSANSSEFITTGSVTGDMGKYGVKLPSADHGMTFNVGTEYRSERYDFSPDFVFLNGLQAGGAPSRPISGGFHVWEAFTEMRLPLINDKPGAFNLSADAGYRYSSYTLGFNTNTYKAGLEWAPLEDARFRGGYNRAVRAPNLDELYEPAAIGAGGTADPCWGSSPSLSKAQCQLTGLNPVFYGNVAVNPAAQINTQTAGNAHLTPEVADTYTLGVVLQPRFVPNFVASIDYFDIKIKNTITSLSSNTIINDCGLTGNAQLCSLIHRGPTGSLWRNTLNFVDATVSNIGVVSTKGLDFAGHYRYEMGSFGRLGLNLTGVYTKDFLTQPLPGGAGKFGGSYDCKGYWGTTCFAPLPSWRHVLNTTWATPWAGFEMNLRWRYIGSSSTDRSSSDPQLKAPFYTATAHIAAYNYLDFSAAIPLWNSVDFRLGINNIADKNPPLILNGALSDCPNTTCNDNSWAGTYDALGRYIFAHLAVKF